MTSLLLVRFGAFREVHKIRLTQTLLLERAYKVLLFPMTFGSDVEEKAIKQNIEDRVARFREVAEVGLHRNVASLRADLVHSNKSVETLRKMLADLMSYSQWAHGMEKPLLKHFPSRLLTYKSRESSSRCSQ